MAYILQGQQVYEDKERIASVERFCRAVKSGFVSGLYEDPIPDHVKWRVELGDRAVYVLEFKPQLRSLLWGAEGYHFQDDDGDEEWTYDADTPQHYTVATPYVVMIVPFIEGGYPGSCMAYYRNEPLKSINDPIFKTNLQNVNEYGICFHHEATIVTPRYLALHEVATNFWSSEFNGHMPGSDWETYKEDGADDRVKSMERWQEESLKDPNFVLGVKWLESDYTLRQRIDGLFFSYSGQPVPRDTTRLGNLLQLADTVPKKRRRA